MLDEDKKSCILLRTEDGKWQIVGAVLGVAALIIAVIITVGTFKYRSARVGFLCFTCSGTNSILCVLAGLRMSVFSAFITFALS